MRITVLGATGQVGSRVVAEALSRGHEVIAVVRDPARLQELPVAADARVGDAGNIEDVVDVSAGQDVFISAIRPPRGKESEVEATTKALMDGLARTGVRLLVVGGAASLVVPGSGGRIVLDDPSYVPASWREVAKASLAQYKTCRAEARVDWAYLSPPVQLVPGERTGNYRLGKDELLIDAEGNSTISLEDLAAVLLDEAEHPRHHRTRFTAAY